MHTECLNIVISTIPVGTAMVASGFGAGFVCSKSQEPTPNCWPVPCSLLRLPYSGLSIYKHEVGCPTQAVWYEANDGQNSVAM